MIIYEADQRHAELLCRGLGFATNTTGVVTPGVHPQLEEDDDNELNEQEASSFRALAARANYLAQDRPDIQYATESLCRDLSSPKERSWQILKLLGRYLQDKPRLAHNFLRQ